MFYATPLNDDSGRVSVMLKNMTIKQAQQEIKEFIEKQGKDWTQIDNHFYLFTHLSEEVGELARHIIDADFNLSDRKTREPMPRQKAISQIEDDLGDLLYHLFKLATAYNIDLGEAFEKAVTNIKNRYGKN
jgi:NTP pyrophosphatase (non-canonical NTP hydrolase)